MIANYTIFLIKILLRSKINFLNIFCAIKPICMNMVIFKTLKIFQSVFCTVMPRTRFASLNISDNAATLVNSSILLKILFLVIWLMAFCGFHTTCFDYIYSSYPNSFLLHHLPYQFNCVSIFSSYCYTTKSSPDLREQL